MVCVVEENSGSVSYFDGRRGNKRVVVVFFFFVIHQLLQDIECVQKIAGQFREKVTKLFLQYRNSFVYYCGCGSCFLHTIFLVHQ